MMSGIYEIESLMKFPASLDTKDDGFSTKHYVSFIIIWKYNFCEVVGAVCQNFSMYLLLFIVVWDSMLSVER